MALVPEFISILRDIRDTKYPQIETWYTSIEEIYGEMESISIGTVTTVPNIGDVHGVATAAYDPSTSELDLGIPAGDKGSQGEQGVQGIQGLSGANGTDGEAYDFDAEGLLSERSAYDGEIKGFSFLAIDTAMIYFKLSTTSADWSVGAPFGRGTDGVNGLESSRNILYNPEVNINQRSNSGIAGNVDWLLVVDGEFGCDMWRKKIGTTKDFYQILNGNLEQWKMNTEYILSVKKYDNGTLIAQYSTILTSPSGDGDWEILVNNPAAEAGSGITQWSIQLEEGIVASEHVKFSELENLYKCMKYYTNIKRRISLFPVDGTLLERRADVQFPVAMISNPVITLYNAMNNTVIDSESGDGDGGMMNGVAVLTGFNLKATVTDNLLQSYCGGYEAGVPGQF